jgi:hypothetical protein
MAGLHSSSSIAKKAGCNHMVFPMAVKQNFKQFKLLKPAAELSEEAT